VDCAEKGGAVGDSLERTAAASCAVGTAWAESCR